MGAGDPSDKTHFPHFSYFSWRIPYYSPSLVLETNFQSGKNIDFH